MKSSENTKPQKKDESSAHFIGRNVSIGTKKVHYRDILWLHDFHIQIYYVEMLYYSFYLS